MTLDEILPAKQPGQHRWTAVVIIPITEEEAAVGHTGEVVRTGTDKVATSGIISCADCHLTYDTSSTWSCEATP